MALKPRENYGLLFGQRVSILPGLKAARKKKVAFYEEPKELSYVERVLQNPDVKREGQKSLEILKSEAVHFQRQVKLLKEELENILNSQKKTQPDQETKDISERLKKTANKTVLYRNIQKKKERDINYQRIDEINDQHRRTIYFKQLVIRQKSKIPVIDTAILSFSDGT